MPAPAVYIIAVLGTVGAVIVFKEFVYEPHIAPAIDRWKAEYQARRRRNEGSEGDFPMSQTEGREARQEGTKLSNDGDTSDDETPLGLLGKGSSSSSNRLMKGLLLKRPERGYEQLHDLPDDVQLDSLVGLQVNESRSGQVLRHRKNVSEHAMDESIHAIPYTPLSPSRTHVLCDSSSPSTPSSGSRPPSPPTRSSPPLQPHPLSFSMTSRAINAGDSASPSPAPQPQDESDSLVVKLVSPSPSTRALPATSIASPDNRTISPPQVYPVQCNAPEIIPIFCTPTSPAQIEPPRQSYAQSVPSLSQSYPQDLDYEHGLELLSPPSSRSLSPFSMAGMSPNMGSVNNQGLRALSPFGSVTSRSASTSAFSSAMSSPSPLRMGLGNESFDTVSPVGQSRQLELGPGQGPTVSPFLDPPSQPQSFSVTNSTKSTTYLSFADDSSDDGAEDFGSLRTQAHPYANLGSTIGIEGTFGPGNASENVSLYPSAPRYQTLQPPISPGSSSASSSNSNSLFLNSPRAQASLSREMGMSTGQTPTQGSILTSSQGVAALRQTHTDALGLILFPVSPREPRAPAAVPGNPSSRSGSTVAVGAGAGDPPYLHPSSPPSSSSSASFGLGHVHSPSPPAQSDGELSDLDFMSESDYAPSEPSDLGNESGSDESESWSIADGSETAHPSGRSNAASPGPRSGAGANSNATAHLSRAGTVRDARGGRFGWR